MTNGQTTQPVNVLESFPLFDTLVVCPKFYGTENQNKGWFTSFSDFAAQQEHRFFNIRTNATAGDCYCNKDTQDNLDYPYEVHNIGVAFVAPSARVLANHTPAESTLVTITQVNTKIAHWWETQLPRHCSIELKVQNDVVSELPAMAASPGYGPTGGGASFEHPLSGRMIPNELENPDYKAFINSTVTQGAPFLKNRWSFTDQNTFRGIQIPKGAILEATLKVDPIARRILADSAFTPHYAISGQDPTNVRNQYRVFPARFMIQVSLIGARQVQQRGNYFFSAG